MPAGLATKPQKTSGQNSAVEERTEFFLHELRDWTVMLLSPGEEGFQLFGDDAVQQRLFRMVRCVFRRSQHNPAGLATWRATALHNGFSNFRIGLHSKIRVKSDNTMR